MTQNDARADVRAPSPVLLASMPPETLDQPSIQLGTLKAILDRAGIPAQTRHYKIDFVEHCAAATAGLPAEDRIGPIEYKRFVVDHYWLGLPEWPFAGPPLWALDDPLDREWIERLRREGVSEDDIARAVRMRALAPAFLAACADDALAVRPRVVGFTTTFGQTLASLALARILQGTGSGHRDRARRVELRRPDERRSPSRVPVRRRGRARRSGARASGPRRGAPGRESGHPSPRPLLPRRRGRIRRGRAVGGSALHGRGAAA